MLAETTLEVKNPSTCYKKNIIVKPIHFSFRSESNIQEVSRLYINFPGRIHISIHPCYSFKYCILLDHIFSNKHYNMFITKTKFCLGLWPFQCIILCIHFKLYDMQIKCMYLLKSILCWRKLWVVKICVRVFTSLSELNFTTICCKSSYISHLSIFLWHIET